MRNKLLTLYLKVLYPEYRFDWVENGVMLTCVDGRRWFISDKRKKKTWNWVQVAEWFVPASICLGCTWVTFGVIVGAINGLIC